MTSADLETGVREQAYKLWEEAGRPEGCDLEIWLKAETIIRDAKSKPAKAKKAAAPNAEAAGKPIKAETAVPVEAKPAKAKKAKATA